MEKDRFNFLVKNYNSLSQQETAELRMEQDRYGYCQVLHQLIARGDQDNKTEMKDQSLQIAAVYSTDRSVLKHIITEPRIERTEIFTTTVKEAIVATPSVEIERVEAAPTNEVEPSIEVPTKESETNKAEVAEIPKSEPGPRREAKVISIAPKPELDFDTEKALNQYLDDLKPMRESRLEFEKALEALENKLNSEPQNVVEEEIEKPKRRGRPKKKVDDKVETPNTTEKLLEEIQTTKKEVNPDSKKHKEQSEIIDQFIKAKPTISKPVANQVQLDLTESNESYNENVVSETLALILIKQGKKEKAIEVLRKLIWKFPQKKAYFAAQIEDLTK